MAAGGNVMRRLLDGEVMAAASFFHVCHFGLARVVPGRALSNLLFVVVCGDI
jgi:hypothetical protein